MPKPWHNAITDVPGVTVGHATVIHDEPRVARTGVTVVLPRGEDTRTDYCFAGYHSFNGCGEMTGLMWIEESGALHSPIGITNTHQCGLVRDALGMYAQVLEIRIGIMGGRVSAPARSEQVHPLHRGVDRIGQFECSAAFQEPPHRHHRPAGKRPGEPFVSMRADADFAGPFR